MKIIHISDIHWRGLSRHSEYRESFSKFFDIARDLEPDVIFVGGDIVHSKTQGISPELIDCLSWWFTSMADICQVHVILGNHDGLILNKDRQDAITPILTALDNPRIHLYKDSGVYTSGIPGFNWCVFSCFDENNWKNVKPVSEEVNIALFHGAVWGSKTDIDWNIEGDVTDDMFEDFEFTLLGDIHKAQFLNKKRNIAYSGSAIQQNYGEDAGKGFLFWDIKTKDDFSVEFIEIPHTSPFITIDWQGSIDKTVEKTFRYPDYCRFRIKSDENITQAHVEQLYSEIKRLKSPTEIVFKIDGSFDAAKIKTSDGFITKDNLRDPITHKNLIKQYYKSQNLDDYQLERLYGLIENYLSRISSEDTVLRNIRWEVSKFRFDNTFSYDKGNLINFDNMQGVTGIFGKNAKGKSAIVGSLMYGLFNTTDRGSISNIHIVNNRKKNCMASIDIVVNGDSFRIKRDTIKHNTRKGETYASTGLSIHRISDEGIEIEDLSGEQRRESDKLLRKMIGTSEDFLLTSLASQGQMGNFIKERATSRKLILTKFLDLEVFEKMHDLAKEDSSQIRIASKNTKNVDWDEIIDQKSFEILGVEKELKDTNEEIGRKRSILQSLQIDLAKSDNPNFISQEEIDKISLEIDELDMEIDKSSEKYKIISDSVLDKEEKRRKIRIVKSEFPIERIKEQLIAQRLLEKSIFEIEHNHKLHINELTRQNKSISILENVPCGDKFPSCMFIKDSYEDKERIENQKKLVGEAGRSLASASQSLKILEDTFLEEKIEKFEKLSKKETDISLDISSKRLSLNRIKNSIDDIKKERDKKFHEFQESNARVADETDAPIASKIRLKIGELEKGIDLCESTRMKVTERLISERLDIDRLTLEKKNFETIKRDLKFYDMFMQAVSKKGIPLQIMMSQLPLINSEILKILHGVVGFTVELEADSLSNSMDIYINYGDSRRIIECASGMEKMLASLAIRVALINISSLPKANMLIIDEGFGALDETNIEACSRLLDSLKKWFKNILVISHVDAIKDTVDCVLDITSKGKNSKVYHE
mgnify:CR=1 FL=1|tara:strand:- start:3738 stop:6875 length:3138 start_codon:yes stop_codon:yes gene_type:complete